MKQAFRQRLTATCTGQQKFVQMRELERTFALPQLLGGEAGDNSDLAARVETREQPAIIAAEQQRFERCKRIVERKNRKAIIEQIARIKPSTRFIQM